MKFKLKDFSSERTLLVFHTAYTFDFIVEQGLEIFVTNRDATDFFTKVITVNAISDLQAAQGKPRHFKPRVYVLDDKNIVVEASSSRFHSLTRFRNVNFIFGLTGLLLKLFRLSSFRHISIIRAEDPRFNGILGFIFSKLLRVPLIVGVWGNPQRLRNLNAAPNMPGLFPNMRIEAAVERFVLFRANLVLAQNSENLSYPKSLGINPSRLMLTPLGIGIDKSHFVPNSDRPSIENELLALGIAPGDLVVLCVSRLEKLKMVDHAILASKYARLAGLEFKLVIVGDGRERSSLELLARKLDISDLILFVGNKDQKWISSISARANLNIAPLCGRSLLEVSLAGCPALAYDVDWHSEIVISGVTGELVKNLDSRAFGNSMIDILSSPSKLQFYSNEMKIKASELASPEKIAQKQREIYSMLCDRYGSQQ